MCIQHLKKIGKCLNRTAEHPWVFTIVYQLRFGPAENHGAGVMCLPALQTSRIPSLQSFSLQDKQLHLGFHVSFLQTIG